MVQGKDTPNRKQNPPVGVDVMASCSFSIYFCASSSSCCCIIVSSSPSLIIIFSFFFRFYTSSSSSRFSSNASWASLEISALYSGGIEMEIADYHSWVEMIYHLFGTDFCSLFLTYFWPSVLNSCTTGAAKIWRGLRRYWWQVNKFWDIGLCHWPRIWCTM